MLNGHKHACPKCDTTLVELSISYLDFVDMDIKQREEYLLRCSDEEQLASLSTTYRLHKYSKWYRKLQEAVSGT
ncbi:MAG: hypothetical protein IKL78_03185 [Lachnospiraceae bacterium]|nr:hypothetical protein [Lachnospiraceae bacterium]